MTGRPQPLAALVHGDPAFIARLMPQVGAGALARPCSALEDLEPALAKRDASLLVLSSASLGGLPALGALISRAGVPVLVAECPDAAAARAALAAGASVALRSDADAAEVAAAARVLGEAAARAREIEFLRMDLEHQRALLMKDDLTAAGNRRQFDFCVAEEVERARESGGKVSLVFMDIDNLKAVNVRHGHSLGSSVLREAAARLIAGVGPAGRVMRYGGDEFCIVLPGLAAADAVAVAERVRSEVASRPFAVRETGGVELTASFGVAEYPAHAADAGALVRAADAAMLAIKEQKNGIQVAASA